PSRRLIITLTGLGGHERPRAGRSSLHASRMVNSSQQPPSSRITRRPTHTDEVWQLRVEVQQYRDMLHRLQIEREFTIRRKWRRLLMAGLGVSVVFHIILILYLSLTYRMPGHPGVEPAAFDVAILNADELIPIGEMEFD